MSLSSLVIRLLRNTASSKRLHILGLSTAYHKAKTASPLILRLGFSFKIYPLTSLLRVDSAIISGSLCCSLN